MTTTFGPFDTYAPPGVYAKTRSQPNTPTLVGGLRIPVTIGVGEEDVLVEDFELIRGSSPSLDEQIFEEDVALSWVVDETNPANPTLGVQTGLLTKFRVMNLPIVDGQGSGRVTNDVRTVTVTVNGIPVAVGSVIGAKGYVILQVPTQPSDAVRCTYFMHRNDTAFTDTVSDQVSSKPASLTSPGFEPFDIGTGTSDTFKLKVDGATKTVTFVPSPAVRALITLAGADANGGIVYRAVTAGTAGNSIRVRHVVAGTSTPLTVAVAGTDITVNVATDGGGAATSTAAQVVAAVLASGPASALVAGTATGSGAGLVVAVAYTNLAGGADGGAAASLKSQIDAAAIPGLTSAVFTDNLGKKHVQLTSAVSLEILDGNADGPLGWTAGTKTSRNVNFTVYQRPIVDGSSGGITTTDPSKVVVKVNGVQVIASAVDGKNGIVTLPAAPATGSTVTIAYFANTWQNTSDELPSTQVSSILRAGISPGRSDYLQNQDFVVLNPSIGKSVVHWGTSYSVTQGTRQNPASEGFDDTQIIPTLVDEKMFMAQCARVVDTTVIPSHTSTTQFILPNVPTTGNGRDTPLGLALFASVTNNRNALDTNRPDLIKVYTGRNLRDAMARAAATVVAVDSATRTITLKDAVPPDHIAYATYWYNRIVDDSYIFTCMTPGAVGSGQYEIFSTSLNTNVFQTKFGTKAGGLTETVNWPRGVEAIPDAFHVGVSGATPVSEVVTVTFGSNAAANARYTNRAAGPYSFYAGTSATWTTKLNGTDVVTTLSSAGVGYLIGRRIVPIQSGGDTGKITIPASPNNVLNLTIDTGSISGATAAQTVSVSVALTPGPLTPAAICTQINAAVDAALVAELGGSITSNCAASTTIGGPSTSDVVFYFKSYSTPGALPGGFDAVSYVAVRSGTVETVLGLAAFDRADGTTGAINKPATLLGTKSGAIVITLGVNDTFKFRMNGLDYTVTIPTSATSMADVVTAISGVVSGVASVATLGNLGKLRLTSTTNNASSALVILNGNANSTLGFTEDSLAAQKLVTPQEVCDRLAATSGFLTRALPYPTTVEGVGTFITIESTAIGASASSVAFVDASNSAFNVTTGVDIVPGVDGDNGEDAQDKFTVTSTSPSGSAGTGTPGQTYTDTHTGLRFTVLPATDGSYTSGGTFTLLVSATFDVNPAVPTYAIPGLETIVFNTAGIGVGDTALVQTFNPGGQEPNNGDFYFITYRYKKQEFNTRLFRQFKALEANYGVASPENRVTLAAQLMIQNGAALVGVKQVKKVVNTNQASTAAFLTAINDLASPLTGQIKPDVLIPLATDTAVYAYLTQHCEIQSNERNEGERMGFIGFASGTAPTTARTIAKSLKSSRIIAVYPDSATITFQNELGQNYDAYVDGTFLAAALAGAVVSPAVDVATPYTRRRLSGITRLNRIIDPVEANQTAVAGITVIQDLEPLIQVRQGLTTDMTNIQTRLPTVTQISDHMQQQGRAVLDTFVGTKYLASRTGEAEVALTGLLKSKIQEEIIAAYAGVVASPNADDQTVMNLEAFYQPIFPLLYLVLTYNLRSSLSARS